MLRFWLCLLALLIFCSGGALSQSLDAGRLGVLSYRGSLGSEQWYFPRNERSPEQQAGYTTLSGHVEATLATPYHLDFRLNLRTQYDPSYSARNRPLVIDDLYVDMYRERYQVRAGYQIVSWKTVESQSQADILNQRDYESDLFDPKKFGEPMLQTRLFFTPEQTQALELYYLPHFRPTEMPTYGNRFDFFAGTPVRVSNDHDEHRYGGSADRWRPQVAARYVATLVDAFDVAAYYFNGYRRFPAVLLPDSKNPSLLHHAYATVQQGGATFQGALGPWLLKGETAYLRYNHRLLSQSGHAVVPYFSYTLGAEYTLYQPLITGHDIGLIAEVIGDTDVGKDLNRLDGFRPFQSHLFLAGRYAFNNDSDRSVLAGSFVNYLDGSTLIRAEYQERLFQRFIVKCGALGGLPSSKPPLNQFNHTLRAQGSLTYYW